MGNDCVAAVSDLALGLCRLEPRPGTPLAAASAIPFASTSYTKETRKKSHT